MPARTDGVVTDGVRRSYRRRRRVGGLPPAPHDDARGRAAQRPVSDGGVAGRPSSVDDICRVRCPPARWTRTVVLEGETVDTEWVVRHAVHDASHHLSDVGRGLHALGVGAPQTRGTVKGLFVSEGGVPKLPVEVAVVGYRGVDGDRQATRQHHGRV
jgi:hypothetical protein